MKYLITILSIAILMFVISCSNSDYKNTHEERALKPIKTKQLTKTGEILQGEHKLKQIYVYNSETNIVDSTYILIRNNEAEFLWELNGQYINYVLNSKKIKVVIDESITNPHIKFRWRPDDEVEPEFILYRGNIIYIVVHCNEKDSHFLRLYQ